MLYVVMAQNYIIGVFTVDTWANNAAEEANGRVVAISAINSPGEYGKPVVRPRKKSADDQSANESEAEK